MSETNLLIGGEAGQGLVTIGQLLSKSLVRGGHEILVTQSYHSRIRGGHNTFAIRISDKKLLAPKDEIDILLALNAETIDIHHDNLSSSGMLIIDKSLNYETKDKKSLQIPYKDLAPSNLYNTAAFGVLGAFLGISEKLLSKSVEDLIGKKHPEILEENNTALKKSYQWGVENKPTPFKHISPSPSKEQRLMLNGNEAIALGALAAGLKFCSFYPMTPSTSIVLNIISHADKMDCIVEQAEDEIAAVNMAIGASFAGAPSMVATSGGGFALMTEGLSLAGMTETPLVVVIAQRPGPATGLPTRTEQGDLEFVLHAGHGEFPRAVFAPGSIDACYHLTQKAFLLAEKYQGPIFILTDQYLADSYRAVMPFDLSSLNPVEAGSKTEAKNDFYKRYILTEDGISPRLIPGTSPNLVVADSDEHTEEGHITEDHPTRNSMVEKRLRKMCGMYDEILSPEFDGDNYPDTLLISWGSSQGPTKEAALQLKQDGQSVATLHFDQVWPLMPNQFLENMLAAQKVVCVEGNATGQFARLLKRETGVTINDLILRYDGLPFTPEYILDRLKTL